MNDMEVFLKILPVLWNRKNAHPSAIVQVFSTSLSFLSKLSIYGTGYSYKLNSVSILYRHYFKYI